MKIFRTDDGENFTERLTTLTGNASEIIRNNQGVWYYFAEKNEGYFHHALENFRFTKNKSFQPNVDYLKKYYDIKYHGAERIADRLADRISFYSKDDYRYGCDLWIDAEAGLTLRSDALTKERSVIDSYMFVEVEFLEPVQKVDLSPSSFKENFVWQFDDLAHWGVEQITSQWSVTRVPDGFRVVKGMRVKAQESGPYYEHLTVTDGLTSISVSIYQSRDLNTTPLVGFVQMGAVNIYGRILKDYHIKVVGEAPMKTIQMIGDSIRQSSSFN